MQRALPGANILGCGRRIRATIAPALLTAYSGVGLGLPSPCAGLTDTYCAPELADFDEDDQMTPR